MREGDASHALTLRSATVQDLESEVYLLYPLEGDTAVQPHKLYVGITAAKDGTILSVFKVRVLLLQKLLLLLAGNLTVKDLVFLILLCHEDY